MLTILVLHGVLRLGERQVFSLSSIPEQFGSVCIYFLGDYLWLPVRFRACMEVLGKSPVAVLHTKGKISYGQVFPPTVQRQEGWVSVNKC